MKFGKDMLAKALALSVPLLVFFSLTAWAEEEGPVPAPEGFMALVAVIPLILIIVLLILHVDMLVAGLAGGVLAMLVGGLTLADANAELLSTIPSMLANTVPILNSAIAMAVFKSGGYTAALVLVRRLIKDKTWIMAAFIILLQSAATYMSGIGGGSAMVIAPLAFAALGAIPELIAGMSIATAACFTTSPASLESSVVSQITGGEVTAYVSNMQPFTLLFVIISVALASWGAFKRNALFTSKDDGQFEGMSNSGVFKYCIPTIYLLTAVILGPVINPLVAPILGHGILIPFVNMVVTIALVILCTKFTVNEASGALVDGSSYILTRLFGVGIFLTFINLIEKLGAFTVIVNLAQGAPIFLLVPAMVLAGFAIGFPAGAYVASILGLILPIAHGLGFSLFEIGLVTMGVGFGSQISYVNITMQALASGFQIDISEVVRGNLKWVSAAFALLFVLAIIF